MKFLSVRISNNTFNEDWKLCRTNFVRVCQRGRVTNSHQQAIVWGQFRAILPQRERKRLKYAYERYYSSRMYRGNFYALVSVTWNPYPHPLSCYFYAGLYETANRLIPAWAWRPRLLRATRLSRIRWRISARDQARGIFTVERRELHSRS